MDPEETSSVASAGSAYPPSFSSLCVASTSLRSHLDKEAPSHDPPPAFTSVSPPPAQISSSSITSTAIAETKASLPRDSKDERASKKSDDGEPPPPYSEGSSPLQSFTYLMAAAGGAASIITQVPQGGGGPQINTIAGTQL